MNHYLVFGSRKFTNAFSGEKRLVWEPGPIGVYTADSPEQAFRAAAADSDSFGTFFVVEGTPHGVEVMDAGATQLGRSESANDRLSRILENMEQRQAKIDELTAGADDE